MSTVSLSATGELAAELHALLRETDPVRWTDSARDRARQRWLRIRSGIELLASRQLSASPLDEALGNIAGLVRDTHVAEDAPKSWWMDLRSRLMPAYEQLALQLRAHSLPAPTLRPTNWNRIAFHASSAFGALVLLELVLTRNGTIWVTSLFAGTFWFLEITRTISRRWNDRLMQVRFFQLIIHPHEHHRINSATWYATALVLLAWFSPPLCSAAALAVLGIGDPLAGLVGRRWGRHPITAGRTLEGSLAFVLGGTVAALGVLLLWHSVASWPLLLGVSAFAALGGTVAELSSRRVDDNFSVPVAAAALAGLGALVLGVPL